MSTASQAATSSPRWMFWTGWVVSVLPAAMLIVSGTLKLSSPAAMAEASKDIGWNDTVVIVALGITELTCAFVYLLPPTAVLGAILLTGYMGGAIATHLRVGEQFVLQALIGVFFWAGLWLRDARVRALLPWRS